MKKLCTLLVTLGCATNLFAGGFGGIIDFTITEGTTSEKTTWYVKGDSVRIDYFYETNSVVRSCYLINLATHTCLQLDHKAKTWEDVIMTLEQADDVEVDTTGNEKQFFGYKTRETIVTPNETTELHYWANNGDFSFYRGAAAWLAFDNVFYRYFWYLPSYSTAMPMLVTQQNSIGTETGRMEVTRLEKRVLNANLFAVPANYKEI